jgi:hypothetical protein
MCATWQPLSDRPVNNSKSRPAIRHHSLVNDLFIAIVGSTLFANANRHSPDDIQIRGILPSLHGQKNSLFFQLLMA